jgi:hypothetical protein
MRGWLLVVSLMSAFSAVPARTADVSGVWSLRLLTKDGESAARVTVTVTQDGEKLTGTCSIEATDQEFTIIGQATDTTLTWRCVSKGPFETSFKGTIDSTGRQMTGEWATPAPAQGTFKGSKPAK